MTDAAPPQPADDLVQRAVEVIRVPMIFGVSPAIADEFAQSKAQALADAEVIRAEGIAEANRIIASSITPEYVDYLFVRALETTDNQVIYVATEAGLPILEASRIAPNGEVTAP